MKKFMTFIFAGVLAGALGMGCETNSSVPVEWADCSVFVKTTPGEETILLARSGLPAMEEAFVVFADFKAEYGEENVEFINLDPHRPTPDAIPNCYEITMKIDVSDVVGKKEWYLFAVMREDGDIQTGKIYRWACTEKYTERWIPYLENAYKIYGHGGKIISSTIKNLGTEIHDMPIEF